LNLRKERLRRDERVGGSGTPWKAGIANRIDTGERIVGAPPLNRPSDWAATRPTDIPAMMVRALGLMFGWSGN